MRKILQVALWALAVFMTHIASAQIPNWVLEDWQQRAQGDGIWIADNSKYKSDDEPYEAYGLEWQLGLGNKSLTGRLYCIQDGKDVRTAWTFLEHWDAGEQKIRMIQVGADGTVGDGHAWQEADGATKSLQTFVNTAGSAFVSGHLSRIENGEAHVSSFDISGDKWTPRRSYVWKRMSAEDEIPTPEEYSAFEFLIGTWQVDLGEMGIVHMSFEWGQNKLMINYKSTNPHKPGEAFDYEVRGIIAYHGVEEQLVFMSAYLGAPPTLMNEGHFEFPKPGVIERIFKVYYKEGSGIPWSNGEKAPEGGKAVDFKQVWTKSDDDQFIGQFFWLKDGKWQHPYPFGEDGKETWTRVR